MVVKTKMATFHSLQEYELGEIKAKYKARTTRRQLEGRHMILENIRGAE